MNVTAAKGTAMTQRITLTKSQRMRSANLMDGFLDVNHTTITPKRANHLGGGR